MAIFAVQDACWLGPGSRGRSIGTEMRAPALHLAFAGLGACEASADNDASNRVSQALRHEPNGTS
jgi:RimJ/RimL family protein N-acetyltransferase